MQKLPESPDRKYGRPIHKKEPSQPKKETSSLSAVISAPISFLALVEGQRAT